MTTKITNLNLKVHISRKLFKVLVIQIASFLLANYILIKFIEYVPYKEVWVTSVIKANMLVMIVFIIIYVFIANKAKNKMYYVDMQNKICVKNGRKIQYQKIEYSQSITQKMFGLVTLKFKNETDAITLKDVSFKAKKYLE